MKFKGKILKFYEILSLKNYEISSNFTKFKNQNFCIIVLKKLSKFLQLQNKNNKNFFTYFKALFDIIFRYFKNKKGPKMRVKMPHVKYIAHKIALDILNSGFVKLTGGLESIAKVANDILVEDLQKERALDERANEIMEKNIDDIDAMAVDKRNMFLLIKKRLADDARFYLNYEDRYSNISHEILESIWKNGLVDYNVSENKVKNIIYLSIENYLKNFGKIEDDVMDKMDTLKRKLIPGTEEYDMVFEKLYEEELKKRGMF